MNKHAPTVKKPSSSVVNKSQKIVVNNSVKRPTPSAKHSTPLKMPWKRRLLNSTKSYVNFEPPTFRNSTMLEKQSRHFLVAQKTSMRFCPTHKSVANGVNALLKICCALPDSSMVSTTPSKTSTQSVANRTSNSTCHQTAFYIWTSSSHSISTPHTSMRKQMHCAHHQKLSSSRLSKAMLMLLPSATMS